MEVNKSEISILRPLMILSIVSNVGDSLLLSIFDKTECDNPLSSAKAFWLKPLLPQSKKNNPPLTTMRSLARNAGEQLVGILMQIIDGRAAEELEEVWKAKMVVRQSTDRISCNDSTWQHSHVCGNLHMEKLNIL
jgi:hypothetical protein